MLVLTFSEPYMFNFPEAGRKRFVLRVEPRMCCLSIMVVSCLVYPHAGATGFLYRRLDTIRYLGLGTIRYLGVGLVGTLTLRLQL